MRGDRALNHCYSAFRDVYKSVPRPPFGKSDQSSVLLLPTYRQKLKREAPALRTIQCWSDQSDAILQDCFDHVDWDMFWAASDDDMLQLEQTTDSSGRRGTGPPTKPGFSQGFFSILSPMEFSFLAAVASGLLSWGHFISSTIIDLIAQILFKLN